MVTLWAIRTYFASSLALFTSWLHVLRRGTSFESYWFKIEYNFLATRV